jgi:hypothetical protein
MKFNLKKNTVPIAYFAIEDRIYSPENEPFT